MEFMLYIQNSGAGKSNFSPEEHLEFVKKCEIYIQKLKNNGNLIAAQPIKKEGVELRKFGNEWMEKNIDSDNFQTGYYHISAHSLEEAISLAKENPEFEFVENSSIKIHEIKTVEKQTGFVYPK